MLDKTWLSLSEYSSKYKVSVSTLRRRVKRDEIDYSFEDGRYFISDQPLVNLLAEKAPPQNSRPVDLPEDESEEPLVQVKEEEKNPVTQLGEGAGVLETTNQLLGEIKKAYAIILQEKEEQLIQLKEEVTDLRTLVRVLEEENSRLKAASADSHSLDEWLKSI